MLIRLFDGTIDRVRQGLEVATRRHEIITRNIANIETAGYRARDLVFEDAMKPGQVPAPDPDARPALPGAARVRLVYANDGAVNEGGSDVNLDRQMARLAENTLFHQALAQILMGQFTALKQAITGR